MSVWEFVCFDSLMLMCDRRVLFCCFLLFWVGFFSWWKVCEAVVIMNGDGCINICYVRRLCACGGFFFFMLVC